MVVPLTSTTPERRSKILHVEEDKFPVISWPIVPSSLSSSLSPLFLSAAPFSACVYVVLVHYVKGGGERGERDKVWLLSSCFYYRQGGGVTVRAESIAHILCASEEVVKRRRRRRRTPLEKSGIAH